MVELPRGTVAFLFTDIEGSTRLWQQHRAAMERAYARHDAVLRGAVADQGGVAYKVIGDAVQAAFPTAEQAVAAALEIQLALSLQDWAGLGLPEPLRVRAALHAGAVDPDPDGDYRSPVLNRLGRLLGAGHGGQVLLSQAAAQLARDRLPEEAALKDLGEHRLKDLLEPEHVWQLVHPALRADFPPPWTLDVARHNLPVQPTLLLGREQPVADVVELVRRPDVRLVTLTGPGGTGKTRLSLQVAAELVEEFSDGVWFVSLAPVADPALVVSTIAETLSVRESGDAPLREQLLSYLQDKQLLLVLDNFEHLLAASPIVAELIATRSVKTVVTSRAPLRLRGEREFPVAPLTLPKRKPPPTAEQLSQYAAVRLFIERAQDVRPDFTVTNDNAPAIAEICHRLDGLPLAIELAAARVRMFPPRAMLSRLEQRLLLLTSGARDLPERQQTLRAAIAWSYDLLSEGEQTLFRRLSVFAGGWTLEAAGTVAGSSQSGELRLDVLSGLEALIEHSLVHQLPEHEAEPRFSMLETIRGYAVDQQAASGEAEHLRERHARFFLELSGKAHPPRRGSDQFGPWLAAVETDHDNLRAALTWVIDQREGETALQIATNIGPLWLIRGHFSEGRRWLERIFAADAQASPTLLAKAHAAASMLARAQGDHRASLGNAEQAVELARQGENQEMLALALYTLGGAHQLLTQTERAAVVLEEALAVARGVDGSEAEVGEILNAQGDVMYALGDRARAVQLVEEGLALKRTAGDTIGVAVCLTMLGSIATDQEDYPRAAAVFAEALELYRGAGDRAGVATTLFNLGSVAGEQGEVVRAVALVRESIATFLELGDRSGFAWALEAFAAQAEHLEDPALATVWLSASAAIREAIGEPVAIAGRAWMAAFEAKLRDHLGSEAFAKQWVAGQDWPESAVIADAMEWASEVKRTTNV